MIGATFSGFHGDIERGIAGEHDHLGVGPLLFDLRQQIQSIGIRQFQIQQDNVRLRLGKGGDQLRGVGFGKWLVVTKLQQGCDCFSHLVVIIYDHDLIFHRFDCRL